MWAHKVQWMKILVKIVYYGFFHGLLKSLMRCNFYNMIFVLHFYTCEHAIQMHLIFDERKILAWIWGIQSTLNVAVTKFVTIYEVKWYLKLNEKWKSTCNLIFHLIKYKLKLYTSIYNNWHNKQF